MGERVVTIWLAYILTAFGASALFIAAGWRSRVVAGSAASICARMPDPAMGRAEAQAHHGTVGDAAEAIDVAIKRLRSVILDRQVRIDVAAERGLFVRTRAATLADLTSELLALGIQAAPGGRLLFTASQHGGRIDITLRDDEAADDAELRRSQSRALQERVAMLGGSLDIFSFADQGTCMQGTSMTVRLAGALPAQAPSSETVKEAWLEEAYQLL